MNLIYENALSISQQYNSIPRVDDNHTKQLICEAHPPHKGASQFI